MAAVDKIAKFLGKSLSRDLIVDITEKCSFKTLAAADTNIKQNATFAGLDKEQEYGTADVYRKGKKQLFSKLR